MNEAFVPVVGTHFRGSDAKRIVNGMTTGFTDFTFEREPDNEYDSNAIKVIVDNEHIGYLARANNVNLAEAMDHGAVLSAEVIDFESRKPVLHIRWADVV